MLAKQVMTRKVVVVAAEASVYDAAEIKPTILQNRFHAQSGLLLWLVVLFKHAIFSRTATAL